jgi:hypothetical protein
MDRAGGCRTPPDEEGTGVTDVPPEDRDPGSLVGFPAAEKVKQLIKVAYNNDEWTSLSRPEFRRAVEEVTSLAGSTRLWTAEA